MCFVDPDRAVDQPAKLQDRRAATRTAGAARSGPAAGGRGTVSNVPTAVGRSHGDRRRIVHPARRFAARLDARRAALDGRRGARAPARLVGVGRHPRPSDCLACSAHRHRERCWRKAAPGTRSSPGPAAAIASAHRRGDRPATAAAESRPPDLRARARGPARAAPRGRASASRAVPHAASCRDTTSWMALRYARYVAPRVPLRMKSFLLSVRHAARSGTSISPLMATASAGVIPSQSQPRLITLPKVLMAMPCALGVAQRLRDVRGIRSPTAVRRAAEPDRDGARSRAAGLQARQLLAIHLERHAAAGISGRAIHRTRHRAAARSVARTASSR